MRPINLIPQEQRRDGGTSRTGPLVYIVVGALFALLAGVVVIVLSSNQISEHESELTALNARKAAAEARADRLSPYSQFQEVQEQRTSTIYELANSRFDWPRVLRQLSLIVPKYVLVTKLTGLASKGIESGEGESGGSDLAGEIKGPSLSIEGCAGNQRRVAALVAALHQIDGVTRVGLGSAVRQDPETGSGSDDSSSSCGSDLVLFSIAVAFDAAPVSPDAFVEGEAAAVAAPEAAPAESSDSTATTEADGSETTVSKTTTVTPPEN